MTNGLVVITFFINIQQETPHLLLSNVMCFSIYCLDKFSEVSYCGASGKSLQLFIAQLRSWKGLIQTDKSINILIFIDPVQHENNSLVQLRRTRYENFILIKRDTTPESVLGITNFIKTSNFWIVSLNFSYMRVSTMVSNKTCFSWWLRKVTLVQHFRIK